MFQDMSLKWFIEMISLVLQMAAIEQLQFLMFQDIHWLEIKQNKMWYGIYSRKEFAIVVIKAVVEWPCLGATAIKGSTSSQG